VKTLIVENHVDVTMATQHTELVQRLILVARNACVTVKEFYVVCVREHTDGKKFVN
jgi:hypothetical protein